MMNIVFLDFGTLFDVKNIHVLEKYGKLRLFHHTSADEKVSRMQDAEIVISNKAIINQEVMEQCPKLRLICVAATGMNNIDLAFAKSKEISVMNVSDYSTQSVAQLTFTLLLSIINSPFYYDQYVKSKQYTESQFFTHIGKPYSEIAGKTWGIIGMGNIGRKVAQIAEAFGAKVIWASVSGAKRAENYTEVDLENLLQKSDFVSIHTPLTEKTKNLINYEALQLMQKHSVLIQVSRGGVVVEADLVRALNENIIAGAGIDVFEVEPMQKDSVYFQILNQEKVVFSPHIAWASAEARETLVEKIAKNIETFQRNS